MNGLFVASLCFAAVCLVSSMPTKEGIQKAKKECTAKYGLSLEDGPLLKRDEKPPKEAVCAVGCAANMLESSEADMEVALDKLGDKFTSEQKEQFKSCLKKITVTDDCELGTAVLECLETFKTK